MVPEYLSNSISMSPPIIKDASFSNFNRVSEVVLFCFTLLSDSWRDLKLAKL